MGGLREKIEADLETTLEGDFGLPVTLKSPDGVEDTLMGQVLYDYVKENPDTGGEMVVNKPVVTLRISSLLRVPVNGEKWFIKIPGAPSETAPLVEYMFDGDHPIEGGKSIGFIRLYLRKIEQTPDE